ncbi:hypothetical protein BST96_07660 [Oceanicoccus sagamiensis]|uniref:Uncharacterized protein n=2 Tax=Oceanicoccus sagamiensis TaxID=716816 RepID=A0A1X9NDN6_9GAMM|nr:hypothetical protein BST96_07660 [Oceanicoccus sagamiensis]
MASKEGHKSDTERHRIEGFMEAGVFLSISTYKAMSDVMARVHLEVWGKTVQQRQEEAKNQWQDDAVDYGIYETPTIDRSSKK